MRLKIQKVLRIYGHIERIFLSVLFVAMLIIMMAQVISRYVFKAPIIWTDELTTLLQVCIAFLGIGYGLRKKSHVGMSGFYEKLPESVQHLIAVVTDILIVVCFYLMIKQGLFYAKQQWNIKTMTMQWTNGFFYICIPIGLIESIVYIIFDIVDHIMCFFHKEPIFKLTGEV